MCKKDGKHGFARPVGPHQGPGPRHIFLIERPRYSLQSLQRTCSGDIGVENRFRAFVALQINRAGVIRIYVYVISDSHAAALISDA